jgi:hypothetical protein
MRRLIGGRRAGDSMMNSTCRIRQSLHKLVEKPWPDGLALACQNRRPGQSRQKAVILAWPSSAYLGLAWLGSQPEARPEQHYAQDTLQGNTTVCLSMNFLDNTPSHHSRGFS